MWFHCCAGRITMLQGSSMSAAAVAVILVLPVTAFAQWLNYPTPGIPRLSDGKPNLAAPAPRKSDGKPDLSGIWQLGPEDRKYIRELNADLKPGGLPMQPWAEDLTRYRRTDAGQSEFPPAHCLPLGVAMFDALPNYPLKIIQEPELVVILYEH